MLTTRKKLFISEYLLDENATQAAIRSGYSQKSAYAQGCRLLKDAEVFAAIEHARDQRFKRTQISADYVLTSIRDTVDRCLQTTPVLDKEGNLTGEYTFNARDALKGLELLGKHLKLFTETVEYRDLDASIERELAALTARCETAALSQTGSGQSTVH